MQTAFDFAAAKKCRLDFRLPSQRTAPLVGLLVILAIIPGFFQKVCAETQPEFPLWPAGAVPGAHGTAPEDTPTLTPYLPEPTKPNRPALIVCPGGGYVHLSRYEGDGYAKWLNEHGIAGFVLKYRLSGTNGYYHHPAMIQDAARALRTVRAQAEKWNIDPKRVGIIGSSAGGHLAATLATHFDAGKADAEDPIERVSSRPDIAILCYPVITMGPLTHAGSKKNLLGENPPPELVEELSAEKQVKNDTPPCFIFHTWEDPAVKVENSLAFAAALREHGVPFDLHIYQKGGHGLGLWIDKKDLSKLHPWTNDCLFWLQVQGFIPK